MPKLKLEIESLQVDSFATQRAPEPRGTVRGNAVLEAAGNEFEEAIALPIDTWDLLRCNSWDVICVKTKGDSCISHCLTDLCGVTDGCTKYTCPSGGDICCA